MARRVKFTKDFDYNVNVTTDIAYKKGQEELVPNAHAEAAIEAGAAEAVGGDEPDEQPKEAGAKNARSR